MMRTLSPWRPISLIQQSIWRRTSFDGSAQQKRVNHRDRDMLPLPCRGFPSSRFISAVLGGDRRTSKGNEMNNFKECQENEQHEMKGLTREKMKQ